MDFSNWGSEDCEKEKFKILKDCILGRKVLEFDYYSSYGEKSTRIIEPMKLMFKGRAWYLYGYCKLKNDYRIFKITRIQNLLSLEESFNREIPKDIWNESDEFS